MRAFVRLDVVADEAAFVRAVDFDGFVNLEAAFRLLRFVLIADQVEVALLENAPLAPPVRRRLNTLQ